MRSLSAQDMLEVWEAGLSQSPVYRSLNILAHAFPEVTPAELAKLDISQRDSCLLDLHESSFGASIDGFSECPHCFERLEFSLKTDEIRLTIRSSGDNKGQLFELAEGNYRIRYRLPNSLDLIAATQCETGKAMDVIMCRCIIELNRGDVPVSTDELTEQVRQAFAAQMADHAGFAEILLDIACPACGSDNKTLLDMPSFLWSEISSEAKRLLRETHVLARAYGWREADIQGMSSTRRHMYLEMVG